MTHIFDDSKPGGQTILSPSIIGNGREIMAKWHITHYGEGRHRQTVHIMETGNKQCRVRKYPHYCTLEFYIRTENGWTFVKPEEQPRKIRGQWYDDRSDYWTVRDAKADAEAWLSA